MASALAIATSAAVLRELAGSALSVPGAHIARQASAFSRATFLDSFLTSVRASDTFGGSVRCDKVKSLETIPILTASC